MECHEQRLILRVLGHWQSLCHGSSLPRRSQIDPLLFGQDWSNCLLIDVDSRPDQSRLSYVGDNLRDPSWPPLDRQTLSECDDGTLLYYATCYVARVLAKTVPISTGGVGMHNGEPVVYRSILLPLGDAAGCIDALLGAINFRVIPITEEIHPLRAHPAKVSQATLP